MTKNHQEDRRTVVEPDGDRQSPTRVDVTRLMRGRHEVVLLHRGEGYRLRVTRQGKLILTK